MDDTLIHLNLIDGALISGTKLKLDESVKLDANRFQLTKIDYILLPFHLALELSKSVKGLKNTKLDKRIIIKTRKNNELLLDAGIIHIYQNLLLIFSSSAHLTMLVPMHSIKSYQLQSLDSIDDNFTDDILNQAAEQAASDIHLQPLKNHALIELRVDGTLQKFKQISRLKHLKVISKFKIMAKMDIAERRLAQDGSASFNFNNRKIDLRLSTAPTIEGESMVIRLLDPETGLKQLKEIGFSKEHSARISAVLHKRQGLVLVTGPTGSGKSTTLYAAMQLIRDLKLNTISIEDPVEYRINEIKQIEVNEIIGNSFANILRHVLRHDPDIIIIGEIRDSETAEIAVQSALTGHLVISTLHTQDACHAISRLMEMGIEPYLIQDTLQAVLAQRLVRKLCKTCQGRACKDCTGSGFKGRTILYEWLKINPELRSLIKHDFNLSKFKQMALRDGMQDFSSHAKKLINANITNEDELIGNLL